MSFTYPSVLFLLLIPALLFVWVWRRDSGRVVFPFDHGRQNRGRPLRFLIHSAESLRPLSLAVVIVVLAGPQQLSEPRTKKVMTNIEFCVDISRSMTAPFGEGTRYDASMAAINDFLDFREGDAFGLTFFGTSVLHWVPLTSDTSAVRCSPPFMRPEVAPRWFNGTMIGKALLACRKVLSTREEGDRMIILVSDGQSFDLNGGKDQEIAKKLKASNITLYAIHIGGSQIPDSIVNITSLTGGEVFNPDDPETFKAVFQRIDEMQETRVEKIAAETMDHFLPYCIAGLSLLATSLLTLFGLRFTPW